MRKLFRWHRGGLEESLATMIEVNDFADIEKEIVREFPSGVVTFKYIRTEFYCEDKRLGKEWEKTYLVLAKESGGLLPGESVMGYSNFPKE